MVKMKTSNSSWSEPLSQTLASLAEIQSSPEPLRLALVGIGNELNGDDAAGVVVARALHARLANQPQYLILEGATAPENLTGSLRRFMPHLVLLVDAAHTGQPAGSVVWVEWQQAAGFSASTHTLPPTLFASYLIHELGCQVALIGIQPEHLDFGEPMSDVVKKTVRRLSRRLGDLLSKSVNKTA